MKLTERTPIPWAQQATYQYGPPGLIPVEYEESLEDCVRRASGYLDFVNPPRSFRISVEGFETAMEDEIRHLATLLPGREDAPIAR